MKNTYGKIILVLLLTSTLCLAKGGGGKGGGQNSPPPAQPAQPSSVVTDIKPGPNSDTTLIVTSSGAPFPVDLETQVMIDGLPATIKNVQKGMQVVSETAPGSAAPEIDLKTPAGLQ